MASNPRFDRLLSRLRLLHDRKNADYAQLDNPYSNFEYAAKVAANFSNPVDRVFATLIGVKLARLQQLTGRTTPPKNESIEDTFVDLANYAAIWASYRIDNELQQPDTAREVSAVFDQVAALRDASRIQGTLARTGTGSEAARTPTAGEGSVSGRVYGSFYPA